MPGHVNVELALVLSVYLTGEVFGSVAYDDIARRYAKWWDLGSTDYIIYVCARGAPRSNWANRLSAKH